MPGGLSMFRRSAGLLVVFLAVMVVSSGCWPWGPRVGKIDITRIVNESPRAKKYQEQLNARYESLVAGLQQNGLSEEELKRRKEEAYAEYQRLKSELEARLDREITAEVQRLAREKSLSVVLFKEAVRYGGIDLTDDVIARLK